MSLGLYLGRGVHVADRRRAWVLRLERAQLIGRDHVGHGAARCRVGNEHGLARVEDGGGLRHEVDAAEHYHVCVHSSRATRELERISREVGDVLHLAAAVVVRQHNGLPLAAQLFDLF